THGTGCTFSSAIACNLALTDDKVQAVTNAKRYLAGAIEAKLDLGHGSGPLYHNYRLSGKEL
ncbi:MAG: bifunctional hydroxymethylpyrimidine kinase/phosphomethylpyrimidine kinase, partial [Ruminiclostridium sp.]|nr:bifunctional hydroxymethylpyrimidine kinase/phosphomethylpyrimidine kinase [Ruminiclostridium sp.]